MRFEGPIDIRPLTVRGTFGIAWKLVRRNFGSVFLYVLLMQLILALGALAVFSPVLSSIIKNDYESAELALKLILTLPLLFVFLVAAALLYYPILNGVLYGEMSSRIYADGASCKMLFKRSKYALKRFFTTFLSLIVCGIVLSIAQSIISSLFGGIFGFAGIVAALPSFVTGDMMGSPWSGSFGDPLSILSGLGAGFLAYFAFLFLLSMAITLCGQCFICFTYPVAVNENTFHFDAVGRSIKLTSKRFGRILGVKALYIAIVICIEIVITALTLLVMTLLLDSSDPALLTAGIALYAALMLVSACLATFSMLYSPAIDTVLYYDARVRLEGRAWLRVDAVPPQGGATYVSDETHYDAPPPDNSGGGNATDQENDNGGEHGA
ncbi:MAG TPA: hypothetical protein VN540_04415 [Clostridia bacterium]|nr:hypothetical protein [Clostridia bacterium]